MVDPEHSGGYALGHDQCLKECFQSILSLSRYSVAHKWEQLNQLSFNQGGVGLRSATRLRFCAYWASWSDCLQMLQKRKPRFVTSIINELVRSGGDCFPLQQLFECASQLQGLGVGVP